MESDRKMKRHLTNAFLVVASVIFALLVLEGILRVYYGRLFFFGNFLTEYYYLLKSGYPAKLDPLLGYKPRSGFSGKKNPWGTTLNLADHGIRSNGTSLCADKPRPSILCVGDSFTFGDGVNDHETWPAYLEDITGICVWNAGVFGYGLDQAILRAEQLVPILKPSLVIVSIIEDDIDRCGL